MTLTLEIGPELEEGLRATAERAGLPPERYVLRSLLSDQVASANTPAGLSRRESEMLQRIGEGPSPAAWTRYNALKEKRDTSALTDTEHDDLIRLVNEIEVWNARRLEVVAELAKIRGVPFRDLVQQLGLAAAAHA